MKIGRIVGHCEGWIALDVWIPQAGATESGRHKNGRDLTINEFVFAAALSNSFIVRDLRRLRVSQSLIFMMQQGAFFTGIRLIFRNFICFF